MTVFLLICNYMKQKHNVLWFEGEQNRVFVAHSPLLFSSGSTNQASIVDSNSR